MGYPPDGNAPAWAPYPPEESYDPSPLTGLIGPTGVGLIGEGPVGSASWRARQPPVVVQLSASCSAHRSDDPVDSVAGSVQGRSSSWPYRHSPLSTWRSVTG